MNEWENYRLIDDALCDLDNAIPSYLNCHECEYFYDCMEEDTNKNTNE